MITKTMRALEYALNHILNIETEVNGVKKLPIVLKQIHDALEDPTPYPSPKTRAALEVVKDYLLSYPQGALRQIQDALIEVEKSTEGSVYPDHMLSDHLRWIAERLKAPEYQGSSHAERMRGTLEAARKELCDIKNKDIQINEDHRKKMERVGGPAAYINFDDLNRILRQIDDALEPLMLKDALISDKKMRDALKAAQHYFLISQRGIHRGLLDQISDALKGEPPPIEELKAENERLSIDLHKISIRNNIGVLKNAISKERFSPGISHALWEKLNQWHTLVEIIETSIDKLFTHTGTNIKEVCTKVTLHINEQNNLVVIWEDGERQEVALAMSILRKEHIPLYIIQGENK